MLGSQRQKEVTKMCSETWNLATGTKNFRFTFGRKSRIYPGTLRQEPRNEKRELHFLLDILPQHCLTKQPFYSLNNYLLE